jgi:hypothetical protein
MAMSSDAPMRLLLGQRAYKFAVSALESRLTELKAFEDMSLAADYPEHAGRPWPR